MKKKLMMTMAAALVFSMGAAVIAAQDNDGEGKRKAAKEARAAAKEKADTAKEKVAAAKERADTAREKTAAAKDKADAYKEKTAAAREKASEARDAAKEKRDAVVDKREDNQAKRIQHGINKGYLTPEETKSLQAQQQKIAAMESSYKSDGKLTKDEFGQLRETLNVASANIWAEKHDTDGKQMATYRLGKNVYAKDSLTSQLSNQNMNGADAKALTGDFRKMLALKNSLANDSLSSEAIAQKQAEYDSLLNKYFEVR
ncbi:MAG: hypothetical protein WC637_08090 [Victivallales bacterium]|jgi:hypothetical protein